MKKPIALIGFYGSSKESVGRRTAIELGIPFFDMGEHMCDSSGMTLLQLYEKTGEDGYRRFERLSLSTLAALGGLVATTGGCVLSTFSRRLLHEGFLSFFLDTPFELLIDFIHPSRHPTVGSLSRLELVRLYEYSQMMYRQTAHHTIDASQPVGDIVEHILDIALAD